MRAKKFQNKGFTLVELLVVVSIISLLSSITMVAFNNARQRAHNASVASNVRQLSTALELYFTKNNGYPPTTNATPGYDRSMIPDFLKNLVNDGDMASTVQTSGYGFYYYNFPQYFAAYPGSYEFILAIQNICPVPGAKAALFYGFKFPPNGPFMVSATFGYLDPKFPVCNFSGNPFANCVCYN